eukprot:m.236482 g.236482  ORF g.236482 m.236482 type:complete len:263 (-) comp17413_c0_seq4:269-1057(-)
MAGRHISFNAFKFLNQVREFAAARAWSLDDVKVLPALIDEFAFPTEWPFDNSDFQKADEQPDSVFYGHPRLVHHIDESARERLTRHYKTTIATDSDILDLCSSWVSHLPQSPWRCTSAVGLGMNHHELAANSQLTSYVVQDLNVDPILPFPSCSFDYVPCVVSVDYLMKPQAVMHELARVLRPGGKALFSQSNRCFPTKVSVLWQHTANVERGAIIAAFLHACCDDNGALFEDISASNLAADNTSFDPLYVVSAARNTAALV